MIGRKNDSARPAAVDALIALVDPVDVTFIPRPRLLKSSPGERSARARLETRRGALSKNHGAKNVQKRREAFE